MFIDENSVGRIDRTRGRRIVIALRDDEQSSEEFTKNDGATVPSPTDEQTGVDSEKESLEKELDKLKLLLAEEKRKGEDHLSRLRYLQADFDNYRKRMDREVQEIEEFSASGLVRKLLTVVDELELAIKFAEARGEKDEFLEGVKMVSKNLNAILKAEGVKEIEATGKPFNPEWHEAVEKVQGGKKGQDTVVEEIRKGFIYKDRVLRPSLVKVELAMRNDKGEPEEGKAE
jgi:molecular chaperone GrpE